MAPEGSFWAEKGPGFFRGPPRKKWPAGPHP